MTERSASEIRQIPAKDFDASVLPFDARIPGTEAFEIAVMEKGNRSGFPISPTVRSFIHFSRSHQLTGRPLRVANRPPRPRVAVVFQSLTNAAKNSHEQSARKSLEKRPNSHVQIGPVGHLVTSVPLCPDYRLWRPAFARNRFPDWTR